MSGAKQDFATFGRIARLSTLIFVWLAMAAAMPAHAAKRLALVIGNDAYEDVEPLARAVADARAYRDLLSEQRGFRVFYAENAGRREMNTRVAEFLSAIEPGDTAMVVYSGHGVQLETQRRDSLYLLPTDFPNRDPGRGAESHFFDSEALNFARLADNVAARGAKLRVFVLDACRNNPFKREGGTRAIGLSRGIGRIQSSSGEFVIYAAAPGEVAFDSLPGDTAESNNSLFTRSFIKHFREGTYLEDVANDVQAEVVKLARAANVEQEPYYSDGVAGRTCLEENCGQVVETTDAAADDEREELYWGYCEGKDEPAYCQAFLAAFPDSWRAPLARARLAVLTAETGGTTETRDGTEVVEKRPEDNTTRNATEEKLPKTGGDESAAGRSEGDKDEVVVAAVDPDKSGGATEEKTAPVDEVFQPTREEVRDTQARLTILGHRPGPVDGLLGGRTRSAIAAYQDAAGLPASGEFTRGLMARLDQDVPQDRLDGFYGERAAAAERAARERAERQRAARERAARTRTEPKRTRTFEEHFPKADSDEAARRAREAAAAKEEAARRARDAEAAERERQAAAERKAAEADSNPITSIFNGSDDGGGIKLRTRDQRDDSELPFRCRTTPARKAWDPSCQ